VKLQGGYLTSKCPAHRTFRAVIRCALDFILRYRLFLLLAAWPTTLLTGQQGKVFFHRIGIEDGLLQGHIFSMTEDREGFLWFCTLGGLAKYDGYQFTNYISNSRDSTSISASFAYKFLQDSKGRCWVATHRGFNRFDRKTGKFARFFHDPDNPHSLSDDRVRDMLEDRQGRLWLVTGSGVDHFDPETNRFLHFRTDRMIVDRHSPVLYEHTDGSIYAATPRGLFRMH